MAYYAQFIHLLTYMEQTTPNEFGETLMELSAEAAATLAAETDEERAARAASIAAAEEWKQDFKALLLLNMAETKRISNTYRGRSGIGEVMEAAVLKIRTAYFEAKAEAKAVALAQATAQAQARAQAAAQAKAKAKAAN
jgi:colicin import membrane protein